MKPIVPVTATRAADTERNAGDDEEPQPADIDAEALRGLFAERQRTERAGLAQQDRGARDDEGQRQRDVLETAVLQRTEQPERDLQHHEGIAGEIHHQCRGGAGETRYGEPREDQDQQPGIAAGDREQREHRAEGGDDRHHRQRVGAHIGQAQRDHQHRAERRRLRRAEQRRRSQRVAQQALQRRAGQPEHAADRERQDGARQADLAHDHLRHVAAAAKQRLDHRKQRQPHRTDAERDHQQQRHEREQRHGGAPPAPRRDLGRQGKILHAHPIHALTAIAVADKRHSTKTVTASPLPGVRRIDFAARPEP